MKDKYRLSSNGECPITTVGELKRILEPFIDSCDIEPINIFYVPLTEDIKGPAKLEIELGIDYEA